MIAHSVTAPLELCESKLSSMLNIYLVFTVNLEFKSVQGEFHFIFMSRGVTLL